MQSSMVDFPAPDGLEQDGEPGGTSTSEIQQNDGAASPPCISARAPLIRGAHFAAHGNHWRRPARRLIPYTAESTAKEITNQH